MPRSAPTLMANHEWAIQSTFGEPPDVIVFSGYGKDSMQNGPYRGGQNSYVLATA